jgi:hypothetical protein
MTIHNNASGAQLHCCKFVPMEITVQLIRELSVLSRQCLDRRIPDKETLISEVAAWENRRNALACKCNWQFTIEDARIKLARLYPVIDA